jgi:hypothetical protein
MEHDAIRTNTHRPIHQHSHERPRDTPPAPVWLCVHIDDQRYGRYFDLGSRGCHSRKLRFYVRANAGNDFSSWAYSEPTDVRFVSQPGYQGSSGFVEQLTGEILGGDLAHLPKHFNPMAGYGSGIVPSAGTDSVIGHECAGGGGENPHIIEGMFQLVIMGCRLNPARACARGIAPASAAGAA